MNGARSQGIRRAAFPGLTFSALLVSACAHGQPDAVPVAPVAPAPEAVAGKPASSAFSQARISARSPFSWAFV